AGRVLGIPQLDRDDDHIDRADRAGIVAGADLRELDVAERAFDDEPPLAHRGQMRAARDEGDLASAGGKARAEIAADGSRSHDGDAHVELPARGCRGKAGPSAQALGLEGIAASPDTVANFPGRRNAVP